MATLEAPTFFCDQCGERYFAAGICQNAHPACELRSIAETQALEGVAVDEVDPANGTEPIDEEGSAEADAASTPIAAAVAALNHAIDVLEEAVAHLHG